MKAEIQHLIEQEIKAIKNIPIDGIIEDAVEILFERVHEKNGKPAANTKTTSAK